MNKLFTYLAIMIIGILITSDAFAQAPEKMSYQAVIRDADGKLVTNTKVGIRIRIQKLIIGMPPSHQDVYVETHNAYKTNENGLLTLMIGTGKVVMGNFADINWSDGTYNLKTETDPEGGTNYNVTGSSPILSVPYAMHSQTAKTAETAQTATTAEDVTKYNIGDYAQGGVIFWLDNTRQHGLACPIHDQSDDIRWNAGTFGNTQAKGDGVYAGKINTAIIIAAHAAIGDDGETYAARVCNELEVTQNGITYGDWYLPSIEEVIIMISQHDAISSTARANGGKGLKYIGHYWSSTEANDNIAMGYWWRSDFSIDDRVSGYGKSAYNYVRAVRAF